MRVPNFFLVLAASAALGLALASGESMLPAEASLQNLKRDLLSERIKTVRVFFVPYEVVTRVRLTPELLQGSAEVDRLVEMDSSMRSSLLRAIDTAKIKRLDSAPDLRWGAVFYDLDAVELHSVYLSGKTLFGTGRQGIIDGNLAKLNAALIDWFESTFGVEARKPDISRS